MPKKKGKKPKEDPLAAVKAVDRTFYELQITDLNLKLSHLRSYNMRTDERNRQLEAEFKNLEEDRSDVNAYLDRTLQEKANINQELEEKLTELSKVRNEETIEFKRQLREHDLSYKQMQDELTSEIKLMTGKLNSLEEFRVQKDELLAKFDQQQDELRTQTKKHNEIIYEIERQQILDKDRMKREVENRLLELSNAFAKSNEIRIAAHVQRLVRENIALNNEMDRMMHTQRRLQQQCDEMVEEAHKRRTTLRTVLEEKDHLVHVSDMRLAMIEKLTDELEKLQQEAIVLREVQKLNADADKRATMSAMKETELQHKMRLLERQLHAERTEIIRNRTMFRQQANEMVRLTAILKEIKFSIRSAMKGTQDAVGDENLAAFRAAQRKNLLTDLMALLMRVYEEPEAAESLETIASVTDVLPVALQRKRGAPTGRERPTRITAAMLMELMEEETVPEEEEAPAAEEEEAGEFEMDEDRASGEGGKEQSEEGSVMVDVEIGSVLVLSESSEAELMPDDEKLEEDAGVSVSE